MRELREYCETRHRGSSRQKVYVHQRNDSPLTAQDMVRAAIAYAKAYNCRIVKPVEYFPPKDCMTYGYVAFEVECHSFTSQAVYDYGIKWFCHDHVVTGKDVEEYRQRFNTTRCIHRGWKRRYWYRDNWHGDSHEFPTLTAAREAASRETGNVVYIYRNYPYGRYPEIACVAPASGCTPP